MELDVQTLIDAIDAATVHRDIHVPGVQSIVDRTLLRPSDFSVEQISYIDSRLLVQYLQGLLDDEAHDANEADIQERDSTGWFNHHANVDLPAVENQNWTDKEYRIINVISEQLGVQMQVIGRNTQFKGDLGSDSLDDIECLMALEDELSIEIPDEDAEAVVTIQDMFRIPAVHKAVYED